ncbi:MAG: Zn-binding domain-containing protein, partial [Anaerolineales bacterium]
VHRSGDKYFWMMEKQPAGDTSLRGTGSVSVVIQAKTDDGWKLVGDVDPQGAMGLVHPEAIYIHDGQTYFVEKLDLEENVAYLHPVEADYYTVPRSRTTVSLVEEKKQEPVAGGAKHFGELNITVEVVGYNKIQWSGAEKPGRGELDLPPIELNTFGYWLSVADEPVERLRDLGLWTNDANEYGPNWPSQRDAARLRDGYACQVCGLPENGRIHDVHHKTPFRTFSYREANQLENLITLCSSCHRQAETVVRIRSGLAGLSYVLRNLAPLYLMCDSQDLGVHSDPKSDLVEGRPAVVMFDQIGNGMGFSETLYDLHNEILGSALELVSGCQCNDGCPSCVGPGGEQGQGSKRETLALLTELVAAKRAGIS